MLYRLTVKAAHYVPYLHFLFGTDLSVAVVITTPARRKSGVVV